MFETIPPKSPLKDGTHIRSTEGQKNKNIRNRKYYVSKTRRWVEKTISKPTLGLLLGHSIKIFNQKNQQSNCRPTCRYTMKHGQNDDEKLSKRKNLKSQKRGNL